MELKCLSSSLTMSQIRTKKRASFNRKAINPILKWTLSNTKEVLVKGLDIFPLKSVLEATDWEEEAEFKVAINGQFPGLHYHILPDTSLVHFQRMELD